MTGEIKGEMKTAKPFADGTSDGVKGEMGHFCSKTLFQTAEGTALPRPKAQLPPGFGVVPMLGTLYSHAGNASFPRWE